MRGKAILFAWGDAPKGGSKDYIGTFDHYYSVHVDELGPEYLHAQIAGFDDQDKMWIAAEFVRGATQWYQESGPDGHGMIDLGWPPFDIERLSEDDNVETGDAEDFRYDERG